MSQKDGDLSREETNKLRWTTMFGRLKSYKLQHGHCRVPQHYSIDPQLGRWVSEQRKHKEFNMTTERIYQLDSIGFSWNAHVDSWNDMFDRLLAYKAQYGDCRVPYQNEKDSALGFWVQRQRTEKESLPIHKLEKLNSIGFVWHVNLKTWDEMFQCLSKYHEAHGHCMVPIKRHHTNPKLGCWVDTQRKYKKASKLTPTQINKLDSLNFVWERKTPHDDWDVMYELLVGYKENHGHCQVPFRYVENVKLGQWVRTQRQQRKKLKLTIEQISKLESIGFLWTVRKNKNVKDLTMKKSEVGK